VAHDALARDIGRQFRTYHCGKFTLNVTRHSVIPGPRGLRSIDIKPSAQSKVIFLGSPQRSVYLELSTART
jgi:hypothetical protein